MIRLLNSNGELIGGMVDATSAVVTEERNGIFELTINYPANGELAPYIGIGCLIEAEPRPDADTDLFRIYGISKPIDRIMTIYAEHISYQLSNIPVSPFETTGIINAVSLLVSNSAESNPFTFESDIDNAYSPFRVGAPQSFRSLLGGVEGSMIDVFGGELLFERYDVKLLAHRGQDNGTVLRYGKNITNFKQDENITATKTGLYPYYKSDEAYVELPNKVISVESADSFPFHRTEAHDFTADFAESVPTVEQLEAKAISYMNANRFGIPDVSIDISFIDLSKTENYKDFAYLEKVNLCDTVTVIFEPYGISAKSKVVKVEYNLLTGRYDSITLGNTTTNLQSTLFNTVNNINEAEKTVQSQFEAAIIRATELITGVRGGYVVINRDEQDRPYEILIMDTPDIHTAVKIWRWNLNGLGYSSSGYNGQYGLAMTMDGQINASMITTGILNAGIIQTGILRSQNGNSWINLDTGEVYFSSVQQQISDIKQPLDYYFTFTQGQGLTIGNSADAEVRLRLQNDNLAFIDRNNNVLAEMTNQQLVIYAARIQSLQIGPEDKLWEITYDHGFTIRRVRTNA